MKIELTAEAMNCLKFWQGHPMYEGLSLSGVIVQQMRQWLNRDHHSWTNKEIEEEIQRIKEGFYNS